MMPKIAIIITGGCINHRKGYMNACISRAVHLVKTADYQVDIYIINEIYREFGPSLLSLGRKKQPESIVIDGRKIKLLWHAEYYAKRYFRRLLNIYYRHHRLRLTDPEYLDGYVPFFKHYALLCVHSSFGGYLARKVKERYAIPYCITWHGSDTHSHPFEDDRIFRMNVASMEEAECNFYVSESLMNISDRLTTKACKIVLYNGAESIFYKYSDEKRSSLRKKYGFDSRKIVAFVGNLYPVKNVGLLPDIFNQVLNSTHGEVQFLVIGDGGERTKIEREIIRRAVPCLFLGNRPVSEMPDYMNCIDVLVLPSRNEGMPLVTIEAISCGANVVGSNAGGIPEVIGDNYCVDLGDSFVERFAAKVIEILNNPRPQVLNSEFDWEVIAAKENKIYKRILSKYDH